ncbi:MAG: sigma-70 family RNA polymerase sigma factor [Actinobacteria bacterium]|nr:sigma-70 family RNA polymerase sigma factor [Actinomycetota bacterium]
MGRNRTGTLATDPAATDGTLAALAADGDVAAFEELYRRHAQAAWRVAQSVTRNREDAADAVAEAFTRVLKALPAGRLRDNANFRSYLLTSARNAALDVHRRTGRVRPTGDSAVFDSPSGNTPSDTAEDKADIAMVAAAFSNLPERWRSVLWLTEVEGIPAREAATMLGVSANGVAQLAVRARAGLRERFLQAHLAGHGVEARCSPTVERLGAYVAGALAPRDLAKVDQHLAGCETCRERLADLEDLGSSLRRIVLPFPLGLAALALGKFEAQAAAALAAATGAAAAGSSSGTPTWLLKAQRPLAVASAGLIAAGIVGIGVVGQPDDILRPGGFRRTPPPADLAAPAVSFVPAGSFSSPSATGTVGTGSSGVSGSTGGATGAGDDGASTTAFDDASPNEERERSLPDDTGGNGGNGTTTTTTPPTNTTSTPPTTAPEPKAQLTVTVNGGSAGSATVAAGTGDGSCTAIKVGPVHPSCTTPPPSSDKTVVIETDGSLLGETGEKTVGLP